MATTQLLCETVKKAGLHMTHCSECRMPVADFQPLPEKYVCQFCLAEMEATRQ